MKTVMGALLSALVATTPIAAHAQPVAAPQDWLGERGPHATGTVLKSWTDDVRGEFTTDDPDDRRRLIVQIWYPAASGTEGERAPYAMHAESYAAHLQAVAGAPPTASILEAPVAEGGPFPVITFGHGNGSPHFLNTFLTEFLASQRYVVAAIGHTGFNGLERFPDGTRYEPDIDLSTPPELQDDGRILESVRAYYARMNAVANGEMVADISFVLDRLEALNADPTSRFHGRLDLERVGAVGYSMGGANAFQATLDEPRIDAAVNLDGDLQDRTVIEAGAAVPVLYVSDVREEPEGQTNAEALEARMFNAGQRWRMLSNTVEDWYRVAIPGTAHNSFGDHYIALPRPPGVRPAQEVHPIIKDLTLAFLDRYVREDAADLMALGDRYPDIRIATNAAEDH